MNFDITNDEEAEQAINDVIEDLKQIKNLGNNPDKRILLIPVEDTIQDLINYYHVA